jgi:hypothetical protein
MVPAPKFPDGPESEAYPTTSKDSPTVTEFPLIPTERSKAPPEPFPRERNEAESQGVSPAPERAREPKLTAGSPGPPEDETPVTKENQSREADCPVKTFVLETSSTPPQSATPPGPNESPDPLEASQPLTPPERVLPTAPEKSSSKIGEACRPKPPTRTPRIAKYLDARTDSHYGGPHTPTQVLCQRKMVFHGLPSG